MNKPKPQYANSWAQLVKPSLAIYVPYATGGNQRIGTIYQAVLVNGSRKFPNSGADSPPL